MSASNVSQPRTGSDRRAIWRLARETARIPAAVNVLVVVVNVVEHDAEVLERREDLHADAHVVLHVREFLRCQLARLVQHFLSNSDLADIVQMARHPNGLDRVRVERHAIRDRRRELGDPLRVSAQVDALGFHRVDERFGHAHRQRAQCRLLVFELACPNGHFIANEMLDPPLLQD